MLAQPARRRENAEMPMRNETKANRWELFWKDAGLERGKNL